MPVSESKKRANAAWNAKNLSTLACSVRTEKAEAFRRKCESEGKTVNAVLLEFVNEYLSR